MDESRQAFLEATLPHLDVLYRVARHAGHDHQRAEDLVQETFLRAYAGFASHRGPSTRAWLVTICLNLIRSEGRRRARRVIEAPLTDSDSYPSERRGVADEALAALDGEQVARALRRLPEHHRLAVVLMDLAGLSAAEVAAELGRPRNTVLSWAHRGHRQLATVLANQEAEREL